MPLPLDNDVWYRLHRRKMTLAAEVSARQPGNRAWIRVIPLENEHYKVNYIEIRSDDYEVVSSTYDQDLYFLVNEYYDANSDDDLERLLNKWMPDARLLKDPYFVGYP